MIRNTITVTLFSLVCFLLNLPGQSISAQSIPISPNSQPSEESRIIRDLELTRGQVEQLATLSQNLVAPTKPLARDLEKAQQKLEQLLASPSASVGEIRDQYRRVELIRQAIYRLEVEYRVSIRDVLTPEQRPKYEEYIRRQVEQTQTK